MSDDKIEFKMLEHKIVGNNVICFKLEDGTLVQVKVEIVRAGVAVNFKNPDGSNHYNIQFANSINLVSKDKKYYLPKSALQQQNEATYKR